jgi:predicted RNA-binding Zn ribbon-like protein
MVEDARETIRDRIGEVESARDDFINYYSQLDAAGDPDIRAPVPKESPPDPDDISAFVDPDVEELVGTLEEMLDSHANVRTCQNPKCHRTFLASKYTREKLYCNVYCRVQAHRAREKAEAEGDIPAPPEGG